MVPRATTVMDTTSNCIRSLESLVARTCGDLYRRGCRSESRFGEFKITIVFFYFTEHQNVTCSQLSGQGSVAGRASYLHKNLYATQVNPVSLKNFEKNI